MFYNKSQIRSMFLLLFFLFFSVILVYSFAGGDGSLGSPYQITNCSELQNMSFDLSANYTLNNDINCGVAPFNTGTGFKPIGNCTGICTASGDDYSFNGSLNGNGFEIQNLFINRSSTDNIGLFGYSIYGDILNLGLTNVNIIGHDNVGSLIGYSRFSTINNTYSILGNVSGRWDVGGLFGETYRANISYSYTSGVMFGNVSVGGLAGKVENGGNIEYSYSSSAITVYQNTGGGLIGHATDYYTRIDNSYAIGNVNGNDYIGGLIGTNNANVSNSYATGTMTGNDLIGGLIGYNYGYVNMAYATGNINGNDYIGGLIGISFFGNVDNSYATGNVIGVNRVGGLVGHMNGELNQTYATGFVNGTTNVGGLTGASFQLVSNSYATGDVHGVKNVGGLIGFRESAENTVNSYSTGDVYGVVNVGGLVGVNRPDWDNGIIENSYSSSNVNGTENVGGLVGVNHGFSSGPGYFAIIENSFSTGNVNGVTNVGGLLGRNNNSYANLSNAYWNNHSGNPSIGIGSDVNAQSTIAVDDNISYFNYNSPPINLWDLNYWTITNSSLPQLTWNYVVSETNNGLASIFPAHSVISIVLILLGVVGFILFN
ncbi:MAG: hypothetical protein KC589_10045 [Nanoarchaeota archaeon]|nr:hypothetical protein [Nanoarchaeota archaeon]